MIDLPATPIGFAALPAEHRARIEAELTPGERLLWAAQPNPDQARGPKRSRASSWIWLGGWLAVGGFCVASVFGFALMGFDTLVGVPLLVLFVAGLITLLMSSHLVAGFAKEGSWRRRARYSLYVLTDQRVLSWRPEVGTREMEVQQFLGPCWIDQMSRRENPDGSGDLILDHDHKKYRGIFGVANIRRVDELVRHVLTHPAPKTPG